MDELVDVEGEFWRAVMRNDDHFYRRNLTEDYLTVVPVGVLDKGEMLEVVAGHDGRFLSCQLTDPAIRQLGQDCDLITYRLQAQDEHEGQTVDMDVFVTTIYVRRDGRWSVAFHQQTPVAAGA